jgi:hypothetical protein
MQDKDGSCNFNSAAANSMGCIYDLGSVAPQSKPSGQTQPVAPQRAPTANSPQSSPEWVCASAGGYRYYSTMMECKGLQESDGSCNFNSSGAMARGCQYTRSIAPKPETTSPVAVEVEEAKSVLANPIPQPSLTELLKEAEKEKQAALASAALLKETIVGIKSENLSVANQLQTGKMDLGSYAKWSPFTSKVSGELTAGEFAENSLNQQNSEKISNAAKAKGAKNSGISEKITRLGSEDRSPSSLELGGSFTVGKNGNPGVNPKESEGTDAWISFLRESEKVNLLNQLRMDPKLRDKLKARLEELKAKGEQDSSTFGFLADLYQESAAGDPQQIADLRAMSVREAFSMDDEETRKQIQGLLSELEFSDPQFLPQESLFERIQWAHKKFAKKEFFRPSKK